MVNQYNNINRNNIRNCKHKNRNEMVLLNVNHATRLVTFFFKVNNELQLQKMIKKQALIVT